MRLRLLLSAVIGLCATAALPAAGPDALTVGRLRVEYADRPLALDIARPRLSWVLQAAPGGRAHRQGAFRLQVASSPDLLAEGRADIWDSGKTPSADSVGVEYAGPPLRFGARCHWRVQVWDAQDRASPWSEPSWWQVGPLAPDDWKAKWIGAAADAGSPLLRRDFVLGHEVVRATAHAYATGWYRLLVNGTELTGRVLAPVNSNYPKGLFYDAYDVTPLVRRGVNAVGLWLGRGYNQSYSKYGYRWDAPPAALLQLEIVFRDGSTQTVVTDDGWKWAASPILENDIYHGETHDARREFTGWSQPGFDDAGWTPVTLRPAPPGPLISCPFPGIAVAADLRPVRMTEPAPGIFIFDLGQNIAGWVRLRAAGPGGTRIQLRHAEELHADGTLDVKTNRAARATDTFILAGSGEETWEPRFTYHGFRYVEVTGYPGRPSLDSLTGRAIRAAVDEAGSFRSSDPFLNRLHENFRWTIANNLVGIPTDTATRDERTPCQMDSLAVEEAAICNFGMAAYYTKWLHDIAGDGGDLPPSWAGDQVVLPYLLYQHYGDRRILARHFDNMKQVVRKFAADAEAGKHWADGFGDWAAPSPTGSFKASFSEGELVGTAFFIRTARIVAETAAILGRADDAAHFARLAADASAAFDARFYRAATATYGSGRQVTSVLPLAFDLVAPANRPAVVAALRDRITKTDGGRLDTGIFGTRYLFEVLIDHGLADLAFSVLTAPGYPGYADQIAQGATTTWEQWSFRAKMQTHNHAMFSGPDDTLFSRLAGIRPGAPGYREIVIRPAFPSGLNSIECSRETPMGRVSSHWHRTVDRLVLCVDIPANATARIHLPVHDADAVTESGGPARHAEGVLAVHADAAGTVFTVGSGNFEFTAALVVPIPYPP